MQDALTHVFVDGMKLPVGGARPLVETLRTPGFRRSDFERLIKRRIEGVEQSKGNPSSVASRVAGSALYGADHPFGAVVTEASLAAITLDDCRAFAARYLVPGNARLFVVGDLGEAEVRAQVDPAGFAAGPGERAAVAPVPAPRTIAPGRGRICVDVDPMCAR